ncbi:MAG TPA: hypothetical protein VHZ81_14410, partial [Galbitalea sp.]|nr:hypothetical protein [Galbitalea sp.]
ASNTLLAMTTTTPARRPVVGLLLAVAGVAALLAILFVFIAPSLGGAWLGIIADAALFLAFLFMAIGRGAGVFIRVLYAIGAVGWAILLIDSFVSLGTVYTIGVVLAIVGTLLSGIVGIIRHVYSRSADLVYLLAAIVVSIILFNQLHGFLTGTLAIIVSVLYGLLLLVAGIFIALRK